MDIQLDNHISGEILIENKIPFFVFYAVFDVDQMDFTSIIGPFRFSPGFTLFGIT